MPMEEDARNPKIEKRMSRRDFSRHAALAAVSVAALPTASLANSADRTFRSLEVSPQSDDKKLSPASQAEVDAKLDIIFKKFGSRFTDVQKTDLRRLASEGQKPLEAIRAYPLENSNQPVTVLKLYPEPGVAQHSLPMNAVAPPAKKE
jgi:hypothetical protein